MNSLTTYFNTCFQEVIYFVGLNLVLFYLYFIIFLVCVLSYIMLRVSSLILIYFINISYIHSVTIACHTVLSASLKAITHSKHI
jgi:hypothetical protein